MDCTLDDIMKTIKELRGTFYMELTEIITLTNMCMIYDDKRNVLVQEKVCKDCIILLGGHVKRHESIVDSMIREIHKETGLTISNIEFCGKGVTEQYFNKNSPYIEPILK
jgi:8-oxo-dGTP pyrophosphatase MutT (NUDIX family)